MRDVLYAVMIIGGLGMMFVMALAATKYARQQTGTWSGGHGRGLETGARTRASPQRGVRRGSGSSTAKGGLAWPSCSAP